jgi:hypothetical protein
MVPFSQSTIKKHQKIEYKITTKKRFSRTPYNMHPVYVSHLKTEEPPHNTIVRAARRLQIAPNAFQSPRLLIN